jgi:hypothetical protein
MNFKRMFYSGTCICGHRWDRHHLSMVMNKEYFNATGEGSIASECLAFGFNEMGGLDQDGKPHCFGYIDTEDPRNINNPLNSPNPID